MSPQFKLGGNQHPHRPDGKRSLRVLTTNACSLLNKLDELLLRTAGVDIIFITETWFRDTDHISKFTEGFVAYRQDRDNIIGGGCLLLVRDCLPQSPFILSNPHKEVQMVSCILHINPPVQLLGVYRSPKSLPFQDSLLIDEISKASASSFRLVIMGNFNAPKIDWSTRQARSTGFEKELVNTLDRYALIQHVEEATRFRSQHAPSTLDLVVTRREDDIANLVYGDPLGKSDHYTLTFEVTLVRPVSDVSLYRPYHKINQARLLLEATNMRWSVDPVDSIWSIIQDNIDRLTDKFAPLTRTGGRTKKPWLKSGVKKALRLKRQAWNTFINLQEGWAYDKYKRLRNKAISMMRRSRLKYELLIARTSQANPKRFFAYAKLKRKQKDSISSVVYVGDVKVQEDQLIAEAFCKYFCSVFRNPCMAIAPDASPQPQTFFEVTIAEVEEAFKALSPFKSAGPDNIHPAVLIPLKPLVLPLLTKLFNHSLVTGVIPKAWKAAIIAPIFKGGNQTLPENYRPVSLTSVVVKLLERVIRNRICAFFNDQDFFNPSQHGFLKGRSCLTNLLVFFDHITQKLDDGEEIDVCYLDFQKAFDSVNHQLLIKKLKSLCIDPVLCDWIKEFLQNRTFRVRVRNKMSSEASPASGVPQGSILGPLLFLIYINDITEGLSSPCFLYADDMKIVGNSDVTSLQADLIRVVEWTRRWDLPLNALMCHLLSTTEHGPLVLPLLDGNRQMTCLDRTKTLG